MLLRNSISNTKRFFQRTLDNVKSFLSVGSTYQKLPKTPPMSCSNNNNELDNFYNEFTHQWDSHKGKVKNKALKKLVRKTTKKSKQFFLDNSPLQKDQNFIYTARNEGKNEKNTQVNAHFDKENNNKGLNLSPGNKRKPELCSRSIREKRLSFVAEKLMELEKMDKGNIDHYKVDVDEFLRYYSHLTCPAYLDIVDNFFMEMCTEFFGSQESKNKANSSRSVLQPLKV